MESLWCNLGNVALGVKPSGATSWLSRPRCNEKEYRAAAGRPLVHMRPHARDELRRAPGTHGRTAHTNLGRLAPASGQSRPAGGWGWVLKRPRPQPQPQPQRLPGPSRNQTPPWVASQQNKTRKRPTSWGHRGIQA
eukprot:scaffold85894_cov67-Phaeocystis_antarctica.AAC.1